MPLSWAISNLFVFLVVLLLVLMYSSCTKFYKDTNLFKLKSNMKWCW